MLWTIQGAARDEDKLVVFWESTMDEGQLLAYLHDEMLVRSRKTYETATELLLVFPNKGYKTYEGDVLGPYKVSDVKEVNNDK